MVRIKKNIIPILILIACLATNDSISQQLKNEIKPDQYRAIHWTMKDGLPSGIGNTMFKDAKGFLWIGSLHGDLCRFDGNVFKKYFPDEQKRGVINSDVIFSFKADSLNNIWIGTAKGLSRYDFKADTFTNFSPFIDSAFPKLGIAPFWVTKDEVFCMEPGSVITGINIHTLKRRKLGQFSKNWSIDWNANKSFFDAGSNSIWKISSYGPNSAVLEQIFLDKREPNHYSWPCYRNNVNHRHDAEDIQYDAKRNSIWINSGDGLLEFSLINKQFSHIDAFNELIQLKDFDRDVGIDIDRQGKIWLSTKPKGIFIYDPKTNRVQPLFSDPDLQKKIGENNLHIYCDRDGIVWTSYYSGAGIYELLPFNHPPAKRYTANQNKKDSLSSGLIFTIVPGPQGKLWIGTANGLNIFDPDTERFEVLRENDLPGIRGVTIIPLYIDTIRQKAWLHAGSQETDQQYHMGMYEMDIRTRKCKRIVFMNGSKQVVIAHKWIRPYKNGIFVWDEKHGVFEIKEGSLIANLLIPFKPSGYGYGKSVQEEDQYMFLQHGGFDLPNFTFENINGKWTKIPHLQDSLFWTSMLYNKNDQTHWVSLKNELVHFDKKFRKIKTYSQEDGYNGYILNMLMDNDGNLWFVNLLDQISRLDPVSGIITTLSETDGYYEREYGDHLEVTKDVRGNLYLGSASSQGKGGLDRINPERYSSAVTSSVYLSSLVINKKPFNLPASINNLAELSLNYNQNTISIETGIIDYFTKGKSHIRYKLEANSEEEDWQYGPAYYTIRYEGLPPGRYRLVLQSSNIGGEFNSPLKILMIKISPPFWTTWWFRIAAILFVLAVFYGIIRFRLRQKFRRQLEISEKEKQLAEMRQKTAELQQQTTELEMQTLRAQMNPHFIFNSLNSINRFILQNDKAQASGYLTKFSRLVRLILQNSQAPLIPLESELEALQLYLELEEVRFNYHFAYKISVQDEMDNSVLKVPPLIIQPYVENSIWHGLMHKEDKGLLDINVSQDDEYLYFKVTDNGIGRKQAAAFASKSATKHKSMGLRITAQRIAMLQKSSLKESPVTINDLVEPDGRAAGTEVIIKMPVIYD